MTDRLPTMPREILGGHGAEPRPPRSAPCFIGSAVAPAMLSLYLHETRQSPRLSAMFCIGRGKRASLHRGSSAGRRASRRVEPRVPYAVLRLPPLYR
jgi:hypothetical protein